MSAILEFAGVDKSFGGLNVIADLTFHIREGSRTALIGPNGSGKTTTFNLISGVYPIDKGAIRFAGEEISALPPHLRVRRGLARSFQNIRLMPHLTAAENVMLGQHSRVRGGLRKLMPLTRFGRNRWTEEARTALAAAGLSQYDRRLVSDLPYGIQKRIEVVRAMAARPRLLLLDEPAAGLNARETAELRALFDAIADQKVTLLVVEHDMAFVRTLCDHVIVLNFGQKIAEGTLDEVRRERAVLDAYFGYDAAGAGDAA